MYYQRKTNHRSSYIRKLKKANPRLSRLLQLRQPDILHDGGVAVHPALPNQIAQSYDYTVEGGLKLRIVPLHHYRPIMVAVTIIALPLMWWLNSSNASFFEPPAITTDIANISIENTTQAAFANLTGNSAGSLLPGMSSMSVLPSVALRSASLLAQRAENSLMTSLEKVQSTLTNVHIKLPQLPPSPWLKFTVRSKDTLSIIFQRHRLNKAQMHEMLALSDYKKQLQNLRPDQTVRIKRDPETGKVEELILGIDFENELRIYHQKKRFVGEMQPRDREVKTVSAQVTVRNSLYNDSKKAGVSQELVDQSIKILRLDKAFIQRMRRGDQFAIVYQRYIIGKKQKDGEILAVKFVTKGRGKKDRGERVHAAVRYTNDTGLAAYYTPEGNSFEDAFLKSPVPSARITSYFGVREHPIFHLQREHKGIDYAASSGSPVLAISAGEITSISWQSGYGKTVEIKHSKEYSSLYAHLSNYVSELAVGQRVQQGQVIAYVGSTGIATGPHLHFEFHVNAVPVNPLTVKLPDSMTIAKEYRTDFLAETRSLMAQLEPTTQQVVQAGSVATKSEILPPTQKLSKLAQLVNGSSKVVIKNK